MTEELFVRAKELLATISYKPGWKFEIDRRQWDGMHLTVRMSMRLLDADGSGLTHEFTRFEMLPVWVLEKGPIAFAHEMNRLVRDVELHESSEWFKVSGVKLFDPHEKDGSSLR